MLGWIARPLNEIGQRWIADQIGDTNLLPGEIKAIRTQAMTVNSRTPEALLETGNVVNGDREPEPPTAIFSARLHSLTERCLV